MSKPSLLDDQTAMEAGLQRKAERPVVMADPRPRVERGVYLFTLKSEWQTGTGGGETLQHLRGPERTVFNRVRQFRSANRHWRIVQIVSGVDLQLFETRIRDAYPELAAKRLVFCESLQRGIDIEDLVRGQPADGAPEGWGRFNSPYELDPCPDNYGFAISAIYDGPGTDQLQIECWGDRTPVRSL